MIPDESLPFADILRSFRTGAGLSQEQLAERSRLSARGISDLERGARRAPRPQTIRMLADSLCLSQVEREIFFEAARPPGLATRALAVSARSDRPSLPLPPTPLIGREQELSSIVGLLRQGSPRLVTLTGPGGVGKTRLALEAIPGVASAFPDGARFVNLAPVNDPSLVRATVARALGLRVTLDPSLQAELEHYLCDKRMVIVLDNVEHVVPGAIFVADLLATCPEITVLATSRMPLRLRGERQFVVRPLRVPDIDAPLSLPELARIESVQLFVERARDIRADFSLSDANAGSVADMCRRLDGLPLAIELAAARIAILAPSTLATRPGHMLHLLDGDRQDVPERHRTLRAAIAWSYDLLGPDEQELFRRLAVFAGGWTVEAAAYVTSRVSQSDLDVMNGIESLVRASLVHEAIGKDGEPRFRMLETVREFAHEELALRHECHDIGQRHANYFYELAQDGSMNLADNASDARLARLEAEQENIRAALEWLRDHGQNSVGIRMAGALGAFWRLRSAHEEGRAWLETFLKSTAPLDGPIGPRVTALRWAGELASLHGEACVADTHLSECLSLARQSGDRHDIAAALGAMASALVHRGDVAEGIGYLTEGAEIARQLGDQRQSAYLLACLAFTNGHQGDLELAKSQAEEAESLVHQLGDTRSFEAALVVTVQGWLSVMSGRHDLAMLRLEEALSLSRNLGARSLSSMAHVALGEVALRTGDITQATTSYRHGLVMGCEGGYPSGIALNLQGLVRIAVYRGDLVHAARLAAAVDAFGGTIRMLPEAIRGQYEFATYQLRSSRNHVPLVTDQALGRILLTEDIVAQEIALPTGRLAAAGS